MMCLGDRWDVEESFILTSDSLSCLAMERVAIARHTTTSAMSKRISTNGTGTATTISKGEGRLRHPLLVALLQRVMRAGFYGEDASDERLWNCNAYGERVN